MRPSWLPLLILAGCTPGPSLEVSLRPDTVYLDTGGQASLLLQLSPKGGFAQEVQLSLEAAPAEVSLEPARLRVEYPRSLELTLRAEASAPAGAYTPRLRLSWSGGSSRLGFTLHLGRACTSSTPQSTYLLKSLAPQVGPYRLLRPLALPGWGLYQRTAQATIEGSSPGPEAWPNQQRRLWLRPNDPLYPAQWYLQNIQAEAGWAVETGRDRGIVVGVVDSGIIPHPDLGLVLPGYDFVSDPALAGDCDGRDPDPQEPPAKGRLTEFHGTHVAGIIGAASNNGLGIAGLHWGARLLPVRAFGGDQASDADILEAMLWAGGWPVPGVPDNPSPAQVLNLSFGGEGACTPGSPYYEATQRLLQRGVVLVAAAGNQGRPASEFLPGNCPGVLSVGATDLRNQRTTYSNYGPRVDLYAPGGDTRRDDNQDGQPDGILSLGAAHGSLVYTWLQGTSFAAPQVSAAAALLLSQNGQLTPPAIAQRLKETARPISPEIRLLDLGAALR